MNKTLRSILIIALAAAAIVAIARFTRERDTQPQPGPVAGKLVVHFLDVGQGDSELIQLPAGETILIDSGDRGAPTVDLLRKFGVKQIDLIIATHPHADHIGEMRDVMRSFKVLGIRDSIIPRGPMAICCRTSKIAESSSQRRNEGTCASLGRCWSKCSILPKSFRMRTRITRRWL